MHFKRVISISISPLFLLGFEDVKAIEHTLLPPGVSFAWPLMLPEHTNALGWDYFDTNIKADTSSDRNGCAREVNRWPTGQKACKLIESSAFPPKPDATTTGIHLKAAFENGLICANTRHTGGLQVEIFTRGKIHLKTELRGNINRSRVQGRETKLWLTCYIFTHMLFQSFHMAI